MIQRAISATVALASASLATWLAWHHPLSPALALAACGLLAGVTAFRPAHWPLWLLPLLPVAGLMTWSGWIVVEELDLAVLAVAAGGWLRMAGGWPVVPQPPTPSHTHATRSLAKVGLLMLPLLVSTLISAERGMADAGAVAWHWWQGYREPLNSVRLAKPVFEVLLLLPLWRAACRAAPAETAARLTWAMTAVLGLVSLAVVWERLAFTGLANFSSDYRATGLFWEMHVGGAALDAVLALCLPFAVTALAGGRVRWRWAVAALVLALGLYAALVTFSRIVYLAVPLGVLVWATLHTLQAPVHSGMDTAGVLERRGPWRAALPWVAGFALGAAWMFSAGGYRGVLALLGALALLLPGVAACRAMKPEHWVVGLGLGLVLVGLVVVATAWMPKGAYIAYGLCWVLGVAALAAYRRQPQPLTSALALAGLVGTLASVVAVAWHWGGDRAVAPGLLLASALAAMAAVAGLRRAPIWPESLRWQAQLLGGLVAVAAVVGIFSGGAYMAGRMASTSHDSVGRQAHLSRSLALLQGSDWWLGKGLGRYWATQWQTGRKQDRTGDYRLLPPSEGKSGQAVALTSGEHDLGSAQALRLSQRLAMAVGAPGVVAFDVRTDAAVRLDLEVCTKHLLYPGSCQGRQIAIKAAPGVWQAVEPLLKGKPLSAGDWYAPPLVVFSVSLGSHASRVELDNLRLTDASGTELLKNGDFERGLAHWYFTSDRYHMPWHAKNMAVHLLFEQGALGLAAWLLLAAAALWRVTVGAARHHALAPALAGALVGVLTVGLVDSLLDMPRVAFLTLLIMAIALALPKSGPRA